jgi:trk system potassium uptake protein TrkA
MRVVAMDNQSDLVEAVEEEVAQAVLLDATDPAALEDAPLEGVETAIVAIGDNIEASILATALLKGRLEVPTVISRAVSPLHEEVLRKVGADRVVNLEIEQGRELAEELITPDALRRLTVADDISVAELYAPKALIDTPLEQLGLREKYRINVLLIRRTTTEVDDYGNTQTRQAAHFPQPSTKLKENDIMVVVGRDHDIDRLRNLAESS